MLKFILPCSTFSFVAFLIGCSDSGQSSPQTQVDAGTDVAPVDASLDNAADTLAEEASQEAAQEAAPGDVLPTGVMASIKTNKGTIVVELNPASPITVENFEKYAEAKFYDGLIFHRVIKGFMIQGGGFESGMTAREPLYPPIKNEATTSKLSNLQGTIAMARTTDPDSATSQFFINTVDNLFLDPGDTDANGYAAFGKVVEGMDVVEAIEGVATGRVGLYQDVPVEDVLIEEVRVTK